MAWMACPWDRVIVFGLEGALRLAVRLWVLLALASVR
jgi:hypothetical protein